jgi:hypothetical protein
MYILLTLYEQKLSLDQRTYMLVGLITWLGFLLFPVSLTADTGCGLGTPSHLEGLL